MSSLSEMPNVKIDNRFSDEGRRIIKSSVKEIINLELEERRGVEVRLAYLARRAQSLGEKLSQAGSNVVLATVAAAEVFPGLKENGVHENGIGQPFTIPPPITRSPS